ncbi:MAG: ATP-binding cassette domain-containing protein [Rhizobiaceae bacterium]|nr:ATP-binding cassette domain-containing protein [Rhizobiaceae bacterium]
MIDMPVLEVKNLNKTYGRIAACRDISFELWPGEVLGIVGESGSGKTTLLKCLNALVDADSGNVTYCSADGEAKTLGAISEAEQRKLSRTEWAYVHQHHEMG